MIKNFCGACNHSHNKNQHPYEGSVTETISLRDAQAAEQTEAKL
jgi:hypothetical protein